jgi:hypothetical protein
MMMPLKATIFKKIGIIFNLNHHGKIIDLCLKPISIPITPTNFNVKSEGSLQTVETGEMDISIIMGVIRIRQMAIMEINSRTGNKGHINKDLRSKARCLTKVVILNLEIHIPKLVYMMILNIIVGQCSIITWVLMHMVLVLCIKARCSSFEWPAK